MIDQAIPFDRDDRGAGSAATATAEEELVEVVVNGETRSLPKAVVEKIEQGGKWTTELTQRAEGLSSKERLLAAKEEALSTRESVLERRVAALEDQDRSPTTTEKKEAVRAAGISLAGLPREMDDPEGFRQGLAERFDKAVQEAEDRAAARATAESGKRIEASRKATEGTSASRVAAQVVFDRNQRTVDAYVQRMKDENTPLTKDQLSRLTRYMDTQLRLPEEGYAARDPASGKIVFTEAALEAADASIRRDYWRERYVEQGLKDGLKRAGSAGDLTGGALKSAPAKTATPSEKASFAETLSKREAERYLGDMPEEELSAVMLHLYRDAEQAGVTTLMGSDD